MRARLYDPYIGRFLSADPVLPDAANLQAYNRYAYVLNNPLKYVDPTGNFCVGLESQFGSLSGSGGCGGGGFFGEGAAGLLAQRLLENTVRSIASIGRTGGIIVDFEKFNLQLAALMELSNQFGPNYLRDIAFPNGIPTGAMDGEASEQAGVETIISVLGEDGVVYDVITRGTGVILPYFGETNYGRFGGEGHLGQELFENPADSPFAPIDAIDAAARLHDIAYYENGIEFDSPTHDDPLRRQIDQEFLDRLNAIDKSTLTGRQRRYIQGANLLFSEIHYESPQERALRDQRDRIRH